MDALLSLLLPLATSKSSVQTLNHVYPKYVLILFTERPLCSFVYVSADLNVNALYDIKGKVGELSSLFAQLNITLLKHLLFMLHSRRDRWWLWHRSHDRLCVRAERGEGLHRVQKGEAAEGGRRCVEQSGSWKLSLCDCGSRRTSSYAYFLDDQLVLIDIARAKSKAGCDTLANAIKEKETKIHILVNNSGATWGAPFDK